MPEQYITICRDRFYSSTAHARQNCTMLFPSFLSLTSMPITFSWTSSQGASCLHTEAPPPTHHLYPHPPETTIETFNIRYDRGCGLAQAIRAVERGSLDCMSLKETIRTEACSNNRRGYAVRCAAVRPSRACGTQGSVGLGSRYRPNR